MATTDLTGVKKPGTPVQFAGINKLAALTNLAALTRVVGSKKLTAPNQLVALLKHAGGTPTTKSKNLMLHNKLAESPNLVAPKGKTTPKPPQLPKDGIQASRASHKAPNLANMWAGLLLTQRRTDALGKRSSTPMEKKPIQHHN